MQIGICADPATLATLPTPFTFDFIEGHVQQFLKPEASDAEHQALLGHAKLENTAFYTKVATRTVRAVISPLDKLAMFTGPEARRTT